MTIYENLGKLCAVSAVVVVGIILSFFIANAIYVGAYRLAKACFVQFWAFIIYAHGSRMKDIIFFLALWFTFSGFSQLLKSNCGYSNFIGKMLCSNDISEIIYDPVSHYSEISGTPCLKWCIFLLLTLLVYIWDCLNAIVSLQAWIHHRCLPSKPGYFHFLVVCCALLQCIFIWFVFPWKFRWILQFAQLEAALSIPQQILCGCQPICRACITFGVFKLFCLILITFIYCIYRTYVVVSYIYRIAGEVQHSFATRLLTKPECRSEGNSRELSGTDDAQAETTMSMLKRSQEEFLREFAEVKNLLAGDQNRFDEKLAGIERQLGDNREKSKEELAGVKSMIIHNRDESKEELADVKTLIKHNRNESKEELADVKTLIKHNRNESKEELADVKTLIKHNRNESKEELADVKTLIKHNQNESKEELADVKTLIKHNRNESKEELADVKTLIEGNQKESGNELTRFKEELVGIRSLSMDNLEVLACTNTLLTDTRKDLACFNTLLTDTRKDLDSTNSLLRDNLTKNVDGRTLAQSRSPYDTSYSGRKSSTRPSSNLFPFTTPRRSFNKGLSLLPTHSLQPEFKDDPFKSTRGAHAYSSNSKNVSQAGKPDPRSETPDPRNSQGIQDNIALPSHSKAPLIDSERSNLKDVGPISEPSNQIRQSHMKSETDISNAEGHRSMQNDSNVNLNATPQVKEVFETDLAQPKTKATSDNASHNAVDESTQSKDIDPNPTVDSSSTFSRPTNPAATGPSSPRKSANLSRAYPTTASKIASSALADAPESPSRPNPSTSRSPEINKENDTGTFTHSESQNSHGTQSYTVPDPTHAGSLQRDENGSESNGSVSANEPTNQRSPPHPDPETKGFVSTNSGCETSMKKNTNPPSATGSYNAQSNVETAPGSSPLPSRIKTARSKTNLAISIPEENSGNFQSTNTEIKRGLSPPPLPGISGSSTNPYTPSSNNAANLKLAQAAAQEAHYGSQPSSPTTSTPGVLKHRVSNSSLASDAARAACNAPRSRQSSQSPIKESHPRAAPVRPPNSRTSTSSRNPIPRSRSNNNGFYGPQILDPLGTTPNLECPNDTSVGALSASRVESNGAKSKSKLWENFKDKFPNPLKWIKKKP